MRSAASIALLVYGGLAMLFAGAAIYARPSWCPALVVGGAIMLSASWVLAILHDRNPKHGSQRDT